MSVFRKASLVAVASIFTGFFSAAQAQSPRYGVVTGGAFDTEQANKIVELGAGSVRLDLYWHDAEQQQDVLSWHFGDHLNRVLAVNRQVYVTIHSTPGWAAACQGPCMPYDLNDWRDFLVRVFNEFGGNSNIVWGIWNEPDANGFLLDYGDARNYAELFAIANEARNAVNPNIRLAGPETTSFSGTAYFHNAMDRILPHMAAHDVVTAHWYPFGNLCGYMQEIASRAGGREVWLTETGHGRENDTEQANMIIDIVSTMDNCSASNWQRTFIYNMNRYASNNQEAILTSSGGNREAFWRYQTHINGGNIGTWAGTISLQAHNGQWVVAENNGGGDVNANRDAVGAWETFDLWDINGGSLESGDQVYIWAGGFYCFGAVDGGGSWLNASYGSNCTSTPTATRLTIIKIGGGGVLSDFDQIALQTFNGHYVVAEGGGGSYVAANRTAIGPWETFTLRRWGY